MSKLGGTTSLADPELMSFDSDFWGLPVARASHPDVARWAADNTVGLMWLLADADRPDEVQDAEARGWRFMDIRVTLATTPRAYSAEARTGIRNAMGFEVDALVTIARESHRITRFYADPRLPDERCDDLYEQWIRESCGGWAAAVLVAEQDAGPAGYVTVHKDAEVASIGLIAVAENARRHGIGGRLVVAALHEAQRLGCTTMTVVTQGRNIAAQRLFQAHGFRTTATQVWLHQWYTEEGTAA